MSKIPYLSSPGNIAKAFAAIKTVATPARVSQDFVKTKLGITGGSGDQITTFLKRIGFAQADGTPTDLYRAYRTSGKDGWAAAQAFRTAYRPLYEYNEYLHDCNDSDLKDIVIRHSGIDAGARSLALIVNTMRNLIGLADFDSDEKDVEGHTVSSTFKRENSSDTTISQSRQNQIKETVSRLNIG